jgi:DNA helicase II / ATP-dependent DNA helicase PcrA
MKRTSQHYDGALSARMAFADTLPADMQADTVHSAKGESHDAILLVADAPRGDRDHARTWVASTPTEATAEEVRIAYVALTRARRYLAVALPHSCPQEIVSVYLVS